MIDPLLLETLACPKCKARVVETKGSVTCQNAHCRLSFPIRDDIPVMLIDEAEQIP